MNMKLIDADDFAKIADDFRHYAKNLFFHIYPLSRTEFEIASMQRRASYDYIRVIIERSLYMVELTMEYFFRRTRPATKPKTFIEAKKLKIIPIKLADSLLELSGLRDKTTHDNDPVTNNIVNENLTVYPKIGKIVSISYGMFELTKKYNLCLIGEEVGYENALIDKEYLTRKLETYIHNNRSGSKELLRNFDKQRLRLLNDYSIPSFFIDGSVIRDICQMKRG